MLNKSQKEAYLYVFNELVKKYMGEVNSVVRGSLVKQICYIQGEIDMLFAVENAPPKKPGEDDEEQQEQERQDRERQ